MSLIPVSDPNVLVMGRSERANGKLRIGYPGVTLRMRFEGSSLGLRVESSSADSRFEVRVDTQPPRVVRVDAGQTDITLAENLAKGAHSL